MNTCGSEFDRNIALEKHMKRHSSEVDKRKFKCKHCLIYLASEDTLKNHIKLKHSNENAIVYILKNLRLHHNKL